MKSMRELIGIMESVMPVSEIVSGAGGSSESDMQTSGTVGRDQSYSAFDADQAMATEEAGSLTEWQKNSIATMYIHKLSKINNRDNAKQATIDSLFGGGVIGSKDMPAVKEYLEDFDEDEIFPSTPVGDDSDSEDMMLGNRHDLSPGVYEEAPPGMEDVVMKLKKEYPDDHSKAFATAWSIYNKKHGKTNEGVPAVDYCKQTNPASADVACAMEEGKMSDYFEQIMNRVYQLSDAFVDEEEAMEIIAKQMEEDGMSPEEIQQMMAAVQERMMSDDDLDYDDSMDGDHDSAMTSVGWGSDEDYGDFPIDEAKGSNIDPAEVNALARLPVDAAKSRALEIITASTTSDAKKQYLSRQIDRARSAIDVVGLMFNMILAGEGNAVQGSGYSRKFREGLGEAYDMNNGYRDVHIADKDDYFPDGADSPVVSDVGPSGARQGDNPEQKKMQIAETHKELVYAYRNFLKESVQKKKLTESELQLVQAEHFSADGTQDLYTMTDGKGNYPLATDGAVFWSSKDNPLIRELDGKPHSSGDYLFLFNINGDFGLFDDNLKLVFPYDSLEDFLNDYEHNPRFASPYKIEY